ncbi:MAG TPA: DNA repair protein RecN [Acidimicrobiales bacterium]|nr:DNA repair protein RecN [Acidimicrobiales bacterium]
MIAPAPARLVELAVTDLGIIQSLRLVFGPGMTALTGETGAGKTMVVGAIELLLGGRADPAVVRPGAAEAVVEGRFDIDGQELVLCRVIPADGRSRAYVNGRMATAATLAEVTGPLVDLHGQHAHQSLLATATQRAALDAFGSVDVAALHAAHAEVERLAHDLAGLGGDAGGRERELDLLRFQAAEILAAGLSDPDEDVRLDQEESLLADAVAHRDAGGHASASLSADGGALDLLGQALAALDGRAPFADHVGRLRGVLADASDLTAEVRATTESLHDDPERLAELRTRRQLLVDLRRKYGSATRTDGSAGLGTLADVIAYGADCDRRVADLEHHDARAAALEDLLATARQAERREAARVGAARREAAPRLATAVEGHLAPLAMPRARFTVEVPDADPGNDVTFMLAANPGLPAGPLAKVASGGELARVMLALRLVVTGAPPILVFDEVDAGIGGDAAVSVGRALAELGRDHQVLVVTHLPQVAACARHQISLRKDHEHDVALVRAQPLDADLRVEEIARMLAGTAGGTSMQVAARELLAGASGGGSS